MGAGIIAQTARGKGNNQTTIDKLHELGAPGKGNLAKVRTEKSRHHQVAFPWADVKFDAPFGAPYAVDAGSGHS